YGLWDALGTRCGVDLPWLAYRDLGGLGRELAPRTYPTGVKWLHVEKHLDVLARTPTGEPSVRAWLVSLRGEKEFAMWAEDDPAPAARWLLRYARRRVRKGD